MPNGSPATASLPSSPRLPVSLSLPSSASRHIATIGLQTASWVSLTDKNRELGDAAKAKGVTNFKNTLGNFKHLIGRNFADEDVQADLARCPYKSEAMADGGVGFKVQYMSEERVFSVTQVVAMLLTKIRTTAETELKSKVTDCCIACTPTSTFFVAISRMFISATPLHVWRILLPRLSDARMLISACNSTFCPIHLFRPDLLQRPAAAQHAGGGQARRAQLPPALQ